MLLGSVSEEQVNLAQKVQ